MPIWTFVNLGEYFLVSTDTTQLRPDESRPPAPRASLKDILLGVLPIALIMSGFFWVGYWTAASNDYQAEPAAGQEYHHWVEL